MTGPISGPVVHSSTNNVDGAGSYFRHKSGWRQKPPFNLVLPYYHFTRETVSASGVQFVNGHLVPKNGNANMADSHGPWQMACYVADSSTPEVQTAIQIARSRFSSSISDRAELLTTLCEQRSTREMIASRATDLYRGYRELRKGNLKGFTVALGLAPKKGDKLRIRPKDAAGVFLEYSFGWAPLVSDIHQGLENLASPFPRITCKGKGKQSVNWSYETGNPGWTYSKASHTGYAKATVSATISVSNPNLWMLNSLGLINPAQTAWELVPFSFVVDYFVNVGSFLGSFSEFAGLTVEAPCTSWIFKDYCEAHHEDWYLGSLLTRRWDTVSIGVSSGREPAIPDVRLRTLPQDRLSLQRAATSIALLVQLMTK